MKPEDETRLFTETVERAIDSAGLNAVLELIGDVLHTKADHIRTNWQDEKLARRWESVGRRLYRTAQRADALGLKV